jgi:CheY-like chemotaxis protein
MKKDPTVLIVDDEPMNVELLRAILAPSGFVLRTACNGVEALALLAQEPVDLILLDVMMPELDGYGVCRAVRADRRLRSLPIILITALHGASERVMGIDAGCDDFVTKPFDKNEVMARIRTLLRLNHYRSQVDEKERFEAVLHGMHDGLLVCGPGLGILRANQRARDLLGADDSGPEWLTRLTRDFRVGYYGDLRRDLRAQDLEFELERPETGVSRPLTLAFRSSLLKDADGSVSSIVILLHDVTEKRRERLRQEGFLNLLSDKLRAPLAVSLKGLAALPGPLPGVPEAEQFLRMMAKIFEFLSLSEAGEPRANGAPIDMPGLQELFLTVAGALRGKALQCDFQLEAGLGLSMEREPLAVLLGNLAENSARFNDQPVARVTLTAVREGACARLSVADNGHGMPSEERHAIFDAFYQVDRREAPKAPGLGLGLAIVKQIVHSHHGEVRADLLPGGGTVVTFTLPLAVA